MTTATSSAPARAARPAVLEYGMRVLRVALSFAICAPLAFAVFMVVFFMPVWISGRADVMLIWGWFCVPLSLILALCMLAVGTVFIPRVLEKGSGSARLFVAAIAVSSIAFVLWAHVWLREPVTWTEDVTFGDGSSAVVRGAIERARSLSEVFGPQTTLPEAYALQGLEPLGITKSWTNDREAPMILDRDREGWFLISVYWNCHVARRGKGALYQEYRFRDGRWVNVPLTENRVGAVANLMPPGTRGPGHYGPGRKQSSLGRISPDLRRVEKNRLVCQET